MHLEDDEVCKVPEKFIHEVDINTHEAQRCCVDCYYRIHLQRQSKQLSNSMVENNVCTIAVQELQEGKQAEMYRITIPMDYEHPQLLKVDLGGNIWTLQIPGDVIRGQQVVVLAPLSPNP